MSRRERRLGHDPLAVAPWLRRFVAVAGRYSCASFWRRGLDMSRVDYEDPECVAQFFGIARALAAEIEYMNDEGTFRPETPRARWERMRSWVIANLEGGLK